MHAADPERVVLALLDHDGGRDGRFVGLDDILLVVADPAVVRFQNGELIRDGNGSLQYNDTGFTAVRGHDRVLVSHF